MQVKSVSPGATKHNLFSGIVQTMNPRRYTKTYIKEWREFRGLSLRRLADRIDMGEGEPISFASIGRIENGLQPYSQPILEAIAYALNCSVTDLLSVDPTKSGEVVDLVRLINDQNREQAIRILKALTGTDG